MKKTTKKIASLCAAVMMMASFALGADAVVSVDKTDSYGGAYYKSSCLATLTNDNARTYYARALTKCTQKCYKLVSNVEVFNSSNKSVKFNEATKTNAAVGNIVTPSVTGTAYNGKKAVYTTYYQTSSNTGRRQLSTTINFDW